MENSGCQRDRPGSIDGSTNGIAAQSAEVAASSNLLTRIDAVNKPDSQVPKSAKRRASSEVVTVFKSRKRQLPPSNGKQDRQQAMDHEKQTSAAELSAIAAIPKLTLKQLKEAIDQAPDINASKVVQLHQRILASEYKIDLDSLTNKLLELESELHEDR